MTRPRVLLVDDSTVVREGLPLLHAQLDFVACYADGAALLRDRHPADLVLLDLHLAGGAGSRVRQGVAAVREVADAGYRICLYTEERRPLVLAQCLRAGAAGVVHKSEPTAAAAEAFAEVIEGRTVITQSLVATAELLERRRALPSLTERQRVVLAARARGEPFALIARRLYISEKTAREHMDAVNRKLAGFVRDASPGDIERALGLVPGDLLDD